MGRMYRFSVSSGGEANIDNPLLASLNVEDFVNGMVPMDQISNNVRIILSAVEEGAISDYHLLEAMRYASYSITLFLLAVANSDVPDSVPASKCLAFLGNIDTQFWNEFVFDNPLANLKFILYTAKFIPRKVHQLLTTKMTQVRRQSYIGYDKRDKKDYNMEGYDEEEEEQEKLNQEKAQRESCIMVYLLLLSQIFVYPIEIIGACIENDREEYGEQITQLHKHLKSKLSVEENEAVALARLRQPPPPPPPPRPSNLHSNSNSNSNSSHNSHHNHHHPHRIKIPTTAWDATKIEFVDILDNPNEEDYKKNSVARHLLLVLDEVIELTHVKTISEESFQYTIKAMIGINNQFPKQLNGEKNTEAVDLFVLADTKRDDCGALTQGVLLYLNEHGYPNMTVSEAISAIKFCINILHHQRVSDRDAATDEVNGHFYTNDVKVLLEVCLRELTNIPMDEEEALRLFYLDLIDAIIRRSTWATAGGYYLVEQIRHLLEEIRGNDSPTCQMIAEEMLTTHAEVLSTT